MFGRAQLWGGHDKAGEIFETCLDAMGAGTWRALRGYLVEARSLALSCGLLRFLWPCGIGWLRELWCWAWFRV
jgi:hypothetical protein